MKTDIFIKPVETIKSALKRLDLTAEKVLIVIDGEGRLLGTLTDGDIRRCILKGLDLEAAVEQAYNPRAINLPAAGFDKKKAQELMLSKKIELIPLVDEEKRVIDYVVWDALFSEGDTRREKAGRIDMPVVIMAGGKGARLDPFTRVLPKPLIPIGDKTILELIISEFQRFAVSDFYLTLNFKGEMIKAYFDGLQKDYRVHYIWEKDFFGTAGSLRLLADVLTADTFIVTNCDILVKAKYDEVLKFHQENRAMITLLGSIQHFTIPYGVLQFRNGGEVTGILEKPEHSATVNTGVYVMERSALQYIPENRQFHMTDLIDHLISLGQRIYTYPVNEKDYLDIGQWKEYKYAIERLSST